jgi:hypothetical protein
LLLPHTRPTSVASGLRARGRAVAAPLDYEFRFNRSVRTSVCISLGGHMAGDDNDMDEPAYQYRTCPNGGFGYGAATGRRGGKVRSRAAQPIAFGARRDGIVKFCADEWPRGLGRAEELYEFGVQTEHEARVLGGLCRPGSLRSPRRRGPRVPIVCCETPLLTSTG